MNDYILSGTLLPDTDTPRPLAKPTADDAALQVSDLSIGPRNGKAIVRNLSLTIRRGEIFGLVGESGSGKSLTASAIAGLLPAGISILSGSIDLLGEDVTFATPRRRREIFRQPIGFVFQNPATTLNPRLTVWKHLREALPVNRRTLDHAAQLLREVGFADPLPILQRYPHELSGGIAQRVMIATAIARDPDLLIADEPTTALDVTVQAQVLDLLSEISRRRHLAVLLISHDLGVVRDRCARLAVMQRGQIAEKGRTAEVLDAPKHSYTRALLAARPANLELSRGTLIQSDPILVAEAVGHQYERHGRAALAPVDLTIRAGASIGIVGESGSGKSTLARIMAGLVTPSQGRVILDGEPLGTANRGNRQRHWGRVQYVFQNTTGSLDPRLDVRTTLRLAIDSAKRAGTRTGESAEDLLAAVNLDKNLLDRLPGQLSGGQRQRLVIARALARSPEVLIADEPVSALDLSVQAHVLRLLARLRSERNMALVLISHDLGVVRRLCDEVLVLTGGQVVERGAVDQVFDAPANDYTRRLIASIPGRAFATGRMATPITPVIPPAFPAHSAPDTVLNEKAI